MIKSFKHKGLRELFESGKTKHIAADFTARLVRQMDAINQADTVEGLMSGHFSCPVGTSR